MAEVVLGMEEVMALRSGERGPGRITGSVRAGVKKKVWVERKHRWDP